MDPGCGLGIAIDSIPYAHGIGNSEFLATLSEPLDLDGFKNLIL